MNEKIINFFIVNNIIVFYLWLSNLTWNLNMNLDREEIEKKHGTFLQNTVFYKKKRNKPCFFFNSFLIFNVFIF